MDGPDVKSECFGEEEMGQLNKNKNECPNSGQDTQSLKNESLESVPNQFPKNDSPIIFPQNQFPSHDSQNNIPEFPKNDLHESVPENLFHDSQEFVSENRFPKNDSQEIVSENQFPKNDSQEIVSEKQFPKNFSCKVCKKQFSKIAGAKLHIEVVHMKMYQVECFSFLLFCNHIKIILEGGMRCRGD